MEAENHKHEQGADIKCPICKELAQKANKDKENDGTFESPVKELSKKSKLLTMSGTPHKIVDGAITVCHDPNCRICRQGQSTSIGLTTDITYQMDLPGPCPRCGDNSCCEGVDKVRVFKLK